MSGQREATWVALLLEHDALTSDDARDFMALADSEQAELRARAEKAEAEARREFESGNDWCRRAIAAERERDTLRDGIQALADDWAEAPDSATLAALRALLNPTPEGQETP